MSQIVDKTGERTLAVVTMADRAPEELFEKERIIARCLPVMVKNISDKLSANVLELERMPTALTSVADVITAFMRIIGASKESLSKLLLRGEFDEYPDDRTKHGTARLVEMLNEFSVELRNCEEKKSYQISIMPIEFAEKIWDFIDKVVTSILMRHSEIYYQLKVSTKRAAHNLVEKMKEQSINRVKEIVQMEKLTDYSSNPDYMMEWTKLMTQKENFVKNVNNALKNKSGSSRVSLEGFGDIEVEHLRQHPNVLQQAFDLKMRMTAYWKIVLKRLVDSMALHLQYSVHNLVNNDIEEIVNELMGPDGHGIERMLVQSPGISGKREKLKKSIKLLESKDVVAKIMDRIAGYGD
ncbi:hypothetical protein CRYUN_Cryun09bG0164700 [Craigia yunnanensis]